MRDLSRWPDENLRAALARSVDRDFRKAIQSEIAWRQHGQPGNNPPSEYLPAFLLVDPVTERPE